MSYENETEIVLQAAEKSGRTFLESECFRQIALNLARIADALEQKKEKTE